MMKVLPVIFLFFLCYGSNSQDNSLPKGAIRVFPDDIKWFDPPNLPAGAKVAFLEGNFTQEGLFTMRVKFPSYYKLPAHWHPIDERATVLEGVLYVGFGDVLDTANATKFTEGCYYVNPLKVHHYVFTGSEGCTFQVTGLGPWGLNYIENEK